MYARALNLPHLLRQKSFFLFGPRGTGKSHLIEHSVALREEGLIAKYCVISQDTDRRTIDGIEIWPWRDFLRALWADQLFARESR